LQPLWLPLGAAAARLGITVQTARRWAGEGRLPAELRQGARGAEYRLRTDAVAARRQVAARESGRLNVLRATLQEGHRPWWRRLKGTE
jgi:predicted site-specific integrase-resolvase